MINELTNTNQLVPRKYQLASIEFCTTPRVKLNETDPEPTLCRSLITHVPGAGKTLIAAEAAHILGAHTLVIAPAHLTKQWFEFWTAQYPNDHVVYIEGNQSKWRELQLTDINCLIVSVQSMRRQNFVKALTQAVIANHITVTIIDESHYIKNRDAKQSHNTLTLTRPAFIPHLIALSATPVVREADDLWHQLKVVDHIAFRSMDTYLNRYCWFSYGSYGPTNVSLRRDAHKQLEAHPDTNSNPINNNGLGWIQGYSYADIGLELPPVIPNPNSHEATPKTAFPSHLRKAYDDIKLFWSHTITSGVTLDGNNAMEIMHLLRALTNCSEKRDTLIQYLNTDPGPYLIGCVYKKSVSDLAHDLSAANYNPIIITGDVDPSKRAELAKTAIHPNDVVVATIASISEGVDLSHLNTVFFYEEDYTPGKMYQFMSRVRRHRNGPADNTTEFMIDSTPNEQGTFSIHMPNNPNSRPVICRYFHIKNSIDERIHLIHSDRAANVKDLIKVELNS